MSSATRLETLSFVSMGLTTFACLGFSPGYNVMLAFFGVYASTSQNGKHVLAYTSVLVLTILLDIIWCSLYGANQQGAGAFALV